VAESAGCLLGKLHHAIVGFPDRLLMRPGGTCAFIEFKRPGEHPTKIQAYWHKRLRGMGFEVHVIRSLHAFKAVLTPATDPCRVRA